MHFSRLRLSGFKSFVDATELAIAPGLTGIVGPNGCGKSNLLEALLWAMGEASARKMRGAGMDDVIFSGSESRPPRNVAEVTLSLDNRGRDAPAAWNGGEEVEVARRIQRGAGASGYRINGAEARARDVQLLFADMATGIRSSGLVGQDRIAALIRARPQARRQVLEEAAGIAGLQARRHEVELRLAAAETNLERLGDAAGGLEEQLHALQRQARQARRYRRLGERIRAAEGRWLLRRWQDARAALASSERALAAVQAALEQATRLAAAAATRQAEATAALAPARTGETQAGGALGELRLAGVALDAEDDRLEDRRRDLARQLERIGADLEREATLDDDAGRALAGLGQEEARLTQLRAGEDAAMDAARAALEQAAATAAALEAQATALAEERARRQAARRALEERAAELDRRRARLESQAGEIAAGQERLEGGDGESAARLKSVEAETEKALAAARRGLEAARQAARAGRQREDACRAHMRDTEAALAGLRAERDALAALAGPDEAGAPVLDSLQVAEGCEAALGAALGDDLDAPLGQDAAAGWTLLPPLENAPALPTGAEPLSRHVRAPPELARRLALTGIVADGDGDRLARLLKPGQRLASRSGRLWRWDGFVHRRAGDGAAARLARRARLQALAGEIAAATRAREEAAQALGAAGAALAQASDGEDGARHSDDRATRALAQAREARRRQEDRMEAAAARRRDFAAIARRIAAERDEIAAGRERTARELAAMPPADADDGLDALRGELRRQRELLTGRQGEHDRLGNEAALRRARLAAIARERKSWQERAKSARARIAGLERQRKDGRREQEALAAQPACIARQRQALAEKLAAAEAGHRRASDRRAEAENALAAADRALREAEGRLADRREERAHGSGAVERARQAADEIARRIGERLQLAPEALAARGEGERLGTAEDLERSWRRLAQERDGMGAVNLRAEGEADQIERRLSAMIAERADLEAAIARLRHGIAELDREGRQRLKAAFEEIDGHFQRLFTRLFGGHARLKMTAGDDPLEAGLEIEASPSGKRLQALSLLSGGEQALTAIALVFALFLTNPSPLCVLDEVDASLDDANVERFCDLLDEFARPGRIRFLIITHHRMTMARMDRLFGVTMGEAGVSQLVSVDMARAERLYARREAS